jgi:hypothetical protein
MGADDRHGVGIGVIGLPVLLGIGYSTAAARTVT